MLKILMCIVLLIFIIIGSTLLFQVLKEFDIPAPGFKKPLFVSGLVFLSGLVGVLFFIGLIIIGFFPEHSHDWLIAIGLVGGIALLLVGILVTVASVKYKSDYVCLILDCVGVFAGIWSVLFPLFFLYTLFDPFSLL